MQVRRQALKILRGARELLSRRARELREQAEAAFKLVESADKAEQAHGSAAEGDAAEGIDPQGAPAGGEAPRSAPQAAPHGIAAQSPQVAQQQLSALPPAQQPQQQTAGAGSGGQASAHASGRGGPGSGGAPSSAAESWRQRQHQRGGAGSPAAAAAAAAAGDDVCNMDGAEGGDDLLDAPPEEPTPTDPWEYGGQPGLHVLDTPEGVRQMCAILLPGGDGTAQQGKQQYSCFGFHFEAVPTGSAAGAAALLPKGPTAAQRCDHAAHDKQSAGG